MVAITDELKDLLNKKLYHQFTEGVFTLFQDPVNAKKPELLDFFKQYIAGKAEHLNLVKFANLLRLSIEGLKPTDALETLELYKDTLAKNKESEILYICIKGRLLAALGKTTESYTVLTEAKEKLKDLLGVDLSVRAAYHLALAWLGRYREAWADVYSEGMLFLSYSSLNDLQTSDILDVTELISVAALAAPRVVDVAELAHHAALQVLKDDATRGWLANLVIAFASGNIKTFSDALAATQAQLAAHPILAPLASQLKDKITLLALIDLAAQQPSKERSLPFAAIAAHCHVPADQVEHLVIRAVARGLARASVDEVDQMVRFQWIKPQILSVAQLAPLRARLVEWADKAEEIVRSVADISPEVTAQTLLAAAASKA